MIFWQNILPQPRRKKFSIIEISPQHEINKKQSEKSSLLDQTDAANSPEISEKKG